MKSKKITFFGQLDKSDPKEFCKEMLDFPPTVCTPACIFYRSKRYCALNKKPIEDRIPKCKPEDFVQFIFKDF